MSSLIVEVCKVKDVQPHPNADRLDIAVIKGWNCIIQKDSYKVDDLVVFIPPDCVLPDSLIDEHELTYLKGNKRTGTVRLRGYLSQGLVLPVPKGKYKEGDDVAEVMGITKYVQPERTIQGAPRATRKRMNPHFSKYFEMENIKNFPDVFTEDDHVVITEKIHGSNWCAGWLPIEIDAGQPWWYRVLARIKLLFGKKYEFCYGSHNVQLAGRGRNYYEMDVYAKIVDKYNFKEIIPNGVIVYGEVYGKGIQDLEYGLSDIKVAIFDIKENGVYLPWEKVVEFSLKHNIPTVPTMYIGVFNQHTVDMLTEGQSYFDHKQMREGIVIRSLDETNHWKVGRKVLKSVSAAYLARKGGSEFK